jgi:hypothetical protein
VIRIMCYLLNMVKVWFVDPHLKLFMKSVNVQFAGFQHFMADMRVVLQVIKASQSASAPRVDMHAPASNLLGDNDDEYHGDSHSFRGADCIPKEAEEEEVVVEETSQCCNMSKKKRELRPQLVVN